MNITDPRQIEHHISEIDFDYCTPEEAIESIQGAVEIAKKKGEFLRLEIRGSGDDEGFYANLYGCRMETPEEVENRVREKHKELERLRKELGQIDGKDVNDAK